MLKRRTGIVLRSSGPKRLESALALILGADPTNPSLEAPDTENHVRSSRRRQVGCALRIGESALDVQT